MFEVIGGWLILLAIIELFLAIFAIGQEAETSPVWWARGYLCCVGVLAGGTIISVPFLFPDPTISPLIVPLQYALMLAMGGTVLAIGIRVLLMGRKGF